MIQQKFKEMNKCKICDKQTKNKVYCSTVCQYNGYKELKVDRIKTVCLFCNGEFETLQNKLNNGKKYCSRSCKDKHRKELYLKNGNPVYGNNHTDDWKNKASIRVKELWGTEEFRNKVSIGQEKFFNDNGFWMGTNEISNNKRISTNLERYGVECILTLEEQIKNRDVICLEKYGKTSFELMRDGLKKMKQSGIEVKISKLLIDNNIKFETQYDIYYGENKYKTYDFYLIDFNLLIEADGDYWHVNPIKYNESDILTETQQRNVENDKFKNKLAKDKFYNLIRFWESDIKKKNFKYVLFNKIKEYGKKEN
jgi:G:T-mismatch repair DNA endonuclease (very short patch repair protein)